VSFLRLGSKKYFRTICPEVNLKREEEEMKIRAIGSTNEILHFTKKLENSEEYVNVEEPSEIFPITDGTDKGKYRRHFKVRQVYKPTKPKKKKI